MWGAAVGVGIGQILAGMGEKEASVTAVTAAAALGCRIRRGRRRSRIRSRPQRGYHDAFLVGAGSIGTASAASAEKVVELWRTYGFVVFAGLFVLRRGWRRERIKTMGVAIRSGGPADIETVVGVW